MERTYSSMPRFCRSVFSVYRYFLMIILLRKVYVTLFLVSSFPTRRSSDLLGVGPESALREILGPEFYDKFFQLVRSEEHTSELQSPYEIVCCLLPEKKKLQTLTSTLHFLLVFWCV